MSINDQYYLLKLGNQIFLFIVLKRLVKNRILQNRKTNKEIGINVSHFLQIFLPLKFFYLLSLFIQKEAFQLGGIFLLL